MEFDIKKIQRRQAIRCMIVSMVDTCHGCIEMNTTNIKKAYNRRMDDVVVFVLQDGTEKVLGDMDTEVIDSDIREWQSEHPTEFNIIMASMHSRD